MTPSRTPGDRSLMPDRCLRHGDVHHNAYDLRGYIHIGLHGGYVAPRRYHHDDVTDRRNIDITVLLDMAQAGDDDARARFVRAVYEELRVIAQRQRRQSSAGNTLNTTAVVHEAYEKLVGRCVEVK